MIMKHIFKTFITLTALSVLFGCSREENYNPVLPEDVIHASFQLKTGGIATKAFSDGLSADGLLVGLYNKQGEGDNATLTYLQDLSVTDLTKIPVSGKAATFETNLVRGQNYVLVFWAQKKTSVAYTLDFATQTLTVSTTGDANDESRDAFYKVFETGTISETNFQFSGIELTRPFAQINVLAPNEDVTAAALSKVIFTKSAMTVSKAPKTMNLLTGAVGDFTATYTMDAAAITEPVFGSFAETHTYIAMNYVLGDDAKKLYDIDLDVYSTVNGEEQSPIHFDVDNAPAQRNYRTNIIGNVFTLDTQFNIIINPIYNEPSYEEGLPGVEFEPVTITPTLPDTTPDGVTVTPSATEGAPATINFAPNAGPLTLSAAATSEAALHARTSNAAVATASVSGSNVTITPVTPGEAIITIYTDPVMATKAIDETKNYAAGKLEYKVVVEAPAEKLDVTITINDVNLKVGEGCELEPDVDPEELYTQIVATPAEGYATYFDWDADNWIIEAKKVTPAEGIAITLSYPGDDTYKEASKTIKVYISEKPVPEVLFENITVTVDQEDNLTYVVDESLEASVTFDEGEQEIYDVYKLGEVWKIKGLKRGTAELTLKVAETATTAPTSVTVTVTSNGKTPTFVTEDLIEINVDGVKQLTKEEDYDLDSDGTVTFSIAEEYATIITCTSAGQIKGLAEGTAKVKINVAASDTFEAGSTDLNVKVNPAPVVEPATATITITGVPTEAQEAGATFDVTITTNSTAALVVSATTGATVAPKTGEENVYTVTCADNLTEDTVVTLTASVAAVENAFTAAEETKTFTVKAAEVVEVLDFSNNVEFEVSSDTKSYAEKALINGATEESDILKLATGSAAGSAIIYVPAGSTKLTFFALAWNGKTSTLTFTQDGEEIGTAEPVSNTGVANSSPYTVAGVSSANQYTINLTSDNPITVSAAKDNRAILFGVKGNGTGAINKPAAQAVETQLSFASANVELAQGAEKTIKATVTPSNAVVKYSSSAAVVAVDETTGKISCSATAEVGATATITATVEAVEGEYTAATASYTVTIVAAAQPGEDPMKATETVNLAYEETFLNSIGKFKAYDEVGIDGQNIWTQSTQYGMVAKAYINNVRYETVSWLYSPNITLGTASKPTLTFSHAGRYLGALTDVSLWVREADGEWSQVAFSGEVTNANFNYVDNTIDLTAYTGKTIQVAFKYTSTTEAAGTYEVKNFKIEDTNTPKFSVDKNEFTVAATTTSVTINITSNIAWTVTPGSGVTADKTSGNGDSAVVLSFAANTDTAAGKEYSATVTASGFDDVNISISQTKAVAAGESSTVTINAAALTSGELSSDGFTLTFAKNNGSTEPTYNTNGGDLRLYAKGTVKIDGGDKTITSIVFNISAQGKKRLAPITADSGSVATQALGDDTVTWTGSASDVTFTVGDKAEYGSDGSDKAGQLDFTSVTITYN